jgi:hydrogenase nickel insertion protein HypA
MHELGLAEQILEDALRERSRHGGGRVVGLRLAVGELSGIDREVLAAAIEVVSQGTALEGVPLDVEPVAGSLVCARCGVLEVETADPSGYCGLCGGLTRVTAGTGVSLRGLVLEEAAP